MVFTPALSAARRKPRNYRCQNRTRGRIATGHSGSSVYRVPALVILEILSIADFLEDYLDARAGGPIHWPIEGRVSAVLLDIVARHPNQRVAVVAHAGVISAALSWYLPEKRWRWWRTTVSNCSITRFRVEGNRAELWR